MLEKWLVKVGARSVSPETSQVSTPDISRVIKLRDETPATIEPSALTDLPEANYVDPDALGEKAEQAVDDLSTQFETWMSADLNQLYTSWDKAQSDHAGPEEIRALFTAAHNIRGVASSYGYPAISRLCGSLSNLLTAGRASSDAALINLHIEACKAAHRSPGRSDVSDAVCDALERRVASTASR